MKAANVIIFREKQMLIPGWLLFVLMSAVSANEMGEKIAIVGSTEVLSCPVPASYKTVTWERVTDQITSTVGNCQVNIPQCGFLSGIVNNATINATSSTLVASFRETGKQHFRCSSGPVVYQTYNFSVIAEPVISPPRCRIIPITSNEGRDTKLTFSCESNVPHELSYRLTMLGFSGNISKRGKSHLHVVNDVNFKNFREYLNVVCELRLSDVDISESCSFPNSTKVTYTPDVTDAVFECHVYSADAVTWRLLDSEGQEEDMTDPYWIRDEGTSILIKNIGVQDLGKVVECRSNGSVGFGVIDRLELSENNGSNGTKRTYDSHGDRLVYVVLTFVFGGLLLLTLLIAISHWRCGACEQPMKWYAQFKPNSKPKTSPMNQLSGSTGPNVSGGGSNSRSPGRDVLTTESNLNSGNQNNSALNHPRDPTPQMKATLSSVADASSSGHPDQPVADTNQHTYFCVERSTPPPSLPDLSTSESMTIYQDPDYEESQRQRLRDSAGYDVVDASKKKVNNNFDMDDYAEVGGAYDMTSNPAIAPHSSKELTRKGIVMSSDPAVLYGKVNK